MKKKFFAVVALVAAVAVVFWFFSQTPETTPVPTPSVSQTASPSIQPTPTPSKQLPKPVVHSQFECVSLQECVAANKKREWCDRDASFYWECRQGECVAVKNFSCDGACVEVKNSTRCALPGGGGGPPGPGVGGAGEGKQGGEGSPTPSLGGECVSSNECWSKYGIQQWCVGDVLYQWQCIGGKCAQSLEENCVASEKVCFQSYGEEGEAVNASCLFAGAECMNKFDCVLRSGIKEFCLNNTVFSWYCDNYNKCNYDFILRCSEEEQCIAQNDLAFCESHEPER